jgi:purine-nucleoside phosphorylase
VLCEAAIRDEGVLCVEMEAAALFAVAMLTAAPEA